MQRFLSIARSERTRPYDYLSDVEFRKDYRFSRHVFRRICEMVQDDLQRQQGRGIDLSVADIVSISIHLLGRTVMQSDAARIAGCHQITVGDALFAFVRALNRRAGQFIFWPREGEKIEIRASFTLNSAFWELLVSSTALTAEYSGLPKEKKNVCRKGYHSLIIGIVVDFDMRVRWVSSKWPGSAHDPWVFTTSILYDQLKKRELQGVLLGDSAYAAETFLLKPLDSPRNLQEERYNQAVCSARTRVEQAFGVLKRQFHISHGDCRHSPSKAAEIVVTCCVLRNIAIGANEPSDYDEYSGGLRQDGEVPSEPSAEAPEPSAISFMRDIIERYF